MKKIIIVSGSPGSGKSTLMKSLEGIECKIANIGSMMEKEAIEKKYIKNRDQIRYLPNALITELRDHAFDEVSGMDGNIILDTHASIAANGRYLPGLPLEALRKLENIVGFVYIDAETEDILVRRINDRTRVRENEDDYLINTQRLINMSVLSQYTAYLNISVHIINNKQHMFEEAKKRFNSAISDLFNENKQ
ncbi:AAA family ATPase [Candidatus Marsarchaeota archaeon]|nr:AAA family ATPase [Candidatus Marsarchaeota archaeon]